MAELHVIIGSSAAALTGLQFVVIVLGAGTNWIPSLPATRAFGTPTVVHFCAVLLVSAILTAPWQALSSVGLALLACALAGFSYALVVVRRARGQTDYVPVLEDWVWHCAFPMLAYGALLAAALVLPRYPAPSLFVIGATAVLLLFVGIHNAWDAVTYMAIQRAQRSAGSGDQS
jgi:hypothetical protein